MKLGISTSCFYPLETEKSFELIGKNGIGITELFFNANCELEKTFIDGLMDLKEKYRMNVVSIHPTMSLAESFMLFSNYPRRYEEGMTAYKRYAEIAACIGAKYIIMHGGKPNSAMDNERYCEEFSKVSSAVRENGAVLLQENVAHYRAGSLSVLKMMKEKLGSEAAFCLDIKQCIRGGYSPYDALELLGDSVKHVHISDNTPENDCMLPTSGNFDFKRFFKILKEKNFSGSAIIEVYSNAYNDYGEVFDSRKKLTEVISTLNT